MELPVLEPTFLCFHCRKHKRLEAMSRNRSNLCKVGEGYKKNHKKEDNAAQLKRQAKETRFYKSERQLSEFIEFVRNGIDYD